MKQKDIQTSKDTMVVWAQTWTWCYAMPSYITTNCNLGHYTFHPIFIILLETIIMI
jgi:hypothetical protein